MGKEILNRSCPEREIHLEDLLESCYPRLQKWGAVLTRGDLGIAQDIVQDLCLHLTLVKPDLSHVENLDGYLYTCLRHIYLSTLTKASRVATQSISIAEFDSIEFVAAATPPDQILQRQNDLRRICVFTVWRKQRSKSASYLILLFFHGYTRSEVAAIAGLPIAAIYSKLQLARTEVKTHLEHSDKLRILTRDLPPEPLLRSTPISFLDLYNEFRRSIFNAPVSECLPVGALLDLYSHREAKPISCSLLSHFVSCERCLAIIDRHFQRPAVNDRKPPEDLDSRMGQKNGTGAAHADNSFRAMMRVVERQRTRVYQHRPRTLSIAINGMITAFHDVQGEQSTLSSRIETPGDVRVVEVFTEQQVRLALISVDVTPPVGPSVQSQLVALSDGRSLELTIRFDGLGLHAEVAYFDPALAGSVSDAYGFEDVSIAPGERQQRLKPIFQVWDWAKSTSAGFVEKWRTFISPPAWGGAFALAFFLCVGGIVAYRLGKPHLDANEILDRSVLVETADLQGKVEHQLVRIGEIAADGNTTHEGTIELWKDSKRHIRRLYDAEHRLIASEWKREDGQVGSYAIAPSEDASAGDRELLANAVWKQDISASSFRTLSGRRAQVRSAGDGYELTSASMPDGPIHLVSAVLVLDRQLRPIKETLRLRGGSSLAREVRFVVTNEERKPIAAVPDAVFNPMGAEGSSSDGHDSSGSKNRSSLYSTLDDANAHAVELQIAVLSQLNQVGADTMDPIDVTRTPDGHIRVFGTVAGNARRQRITAGLQALPDSQLIDIHLGSQHDMRTPSWSLHNLKNPPATIYAIRETRAPVDDILRRHFGTKGWSSERVDSAVAQFSQTALDQARRALQHAYALDRLSRVLSADDAESVSPGSKRQWAAMVAQHAEALESEFQLLHDQLHQIQTVGEPNPVTNDDRTERAAHDSFTHSVNQLLLRTQYMNQCMGAAFATGTPPKPGHSAESLLAAAADSIPVHGADRISKFAFSLAAASEMADQHGASGDRKF